MNYRVITNYENYKIYDNGTVYSDISNKFLNLTKTGPRRNYLSIMLCNQQGHKRFRVHQLVAEYFIEKPEGDNLVVDHINHDTFNNNVNNLRYITQSENLVNRDNKYNKCGRTGITFRPLKIVNGKNVRFPSYVAAIKTPDGQHINKAFFTGKNPNALRDAIAYRIQLEEQYYPNIKVQ